MTTQQTMAELLAQMQQLAQTDETAAAAFNKFVHKESAGMSAEAKASAREAVLSEKIQFRNQLAESSGVLEALATMSAGLPADDGDNLATFIMQRDADNNPVWSLHKMYKTAMLSSEGTRRRAFIPRGAVLKYNASEYINRVDEFCAVFKIKAGKAGGVATSPSTTLYRQIQRMLVEKKTAEIGDLLNSTIQHTDINGGIAMKLRDYFTKYVKDESERLGEALVSEDDDDEDTEESEA